MLQPAFYGLFCHKQYAYAEYREILFFAYNIGIKTGDILYTSVVCTAVCFWTERAVYGTAYSRFIGIFVGSMGGQEYI